MKILIGIQPTGKIHIGNYIGCLKKGLDYQKQGHDVTFLIANYHSLTTDNFSEETEKELIKLGCKNIKKQTPEYTELFFKLCCKLNLGTLLKMPQYKNKKEEVEFDLGVLLYPVLMSADIIINEPDIVLIGNDQIPHMDLCNDISKRIKGKYYKYEIGGFSIKSLIDPSKKMSKSLGEKHVLYLFEENYLVKIRKANMNHDGCLNMHAIAQSLEIKDEVKLSNLELKEAVSNRMQELFGNK